MESMVVYFPKNLNFPIIIVVVIIIIDPNFSSTTLTWLHVLTCS